MSFPDAARLPVAPVLAATTATQAFTTAGVLALAAVAPKAAAELGVSAALVGYQVAAIYAGAVLSALCGGALPRRLGATQTSRLALALVAAGCLLSALGTLTTLALGALVMGSGYGMTNPSASHLLARLPATRHMNLIFSIKQCGVPIGGILAGGVLPPLALALGWQAGLVACAALMLALAFVLGRVRGEWDRDRDPQAPALAAPLESIALVWRHPVLRWLAVGSLAYSAVQLSLTGFLVTYLVAEVGVSLLLAGTLLSVTHAAGAVGRLVWGWVADRARSGTLALIANGSLAIAGALATAAMAPGWPLAALAATAFLFGFCAMGWNGVYMAVVARHSAPQSVGVATGGAIGITFAGVIVGPSLFAALHERAGFAYAEGYALLALITALGVACMVRARALRPGLAHPALR